MEIHPSRKHRGRGEIFDLGGILGLLVAFVLIALLIGPIVGAIVSMVSALLPVLPIVVVGLVAAWLLSR